MAGHERGGPMRTSGVIYPVVSELIPQKLHLDRLQIAALRGALADRTGCALTKPVVIANGANGGIWVESLR